MRVLGEPEAGGGIVRGESLVAGKVVSGQRVTGLFEGLQESGVSLGGAGEDLQCHFLEVGAFLEQKGENYRDELHRHFTKSFV